MAQPSAYVLGYDFSDFQASNPSTPLPGDRLDTELATISAIFTQYKTNIALIQRDDGELANASVGVDQVASSLAAAMAVGGNPRGPWVTATAYAQADVVSNSGVTYICVTAHTSGTFATDLAADKWLVISGTAGGTSFTSSASISATTVQGAIEETYSEKQASAAVLTGIATISAVSPTDPSAGMVPWMTSLSAATPKEVTSAALLVLDDTTVSAMVATLGGGATGSALFVAGTASAARATLSAGAIGDAVFVAATVAAAHTALPTSALSAATVASGDLVVIADINDSNIPKQVTAQGIADLAAGAVFDVQTFTSSGTWTKPSAGSFALIEIWGAGGGGARRGTGNASGGGGGSYDYFFMAVSALSATETVTIGAGGAVQSTDNTDGNAGGDTSFGSHATSYGGRGGKQAAAGTEVRGGGAGSFGVDVWTTYSFADTSAAGTAGVGMFQHNSGIAGNLSAFAASIMSGTGVTSGNIAQTAQVIAMMGGGGGFSTTGPSTGLGVITAGPANVKGGNGGNGNAGGAGVNGGNPGGGGGAGTTQGGSGGNGQIRVTVW